MSIQAFKAFGYLTIFLNMLMFGSGLAQALLGLHSNTSDSIRMVLAFFVILIIGAGLVHLRRWAAVYFSVPLFCVGAWLSWSSIEAVSFPWNLLCMFEGVSLMLPAVITIRWWSDLSAGGKWFY